jgi:hypothetical protein
MPSRRAVLAGAFGVGAVVVVALASDLRSCSGTVPGIDSVQTDDAVTVGGRVRNVAPDGTSIRVAGGTTAIVEFPPAEWDDVKTLDSGSCIDGVEGTVRGIDHEDDIVFVADGEL